ncbi:hypothetical protein ACCT09_44525, partial [Rhizobium ruizarguesonis]
LLFGMDQPACRPIGASCDPRPALLFAFPSYRRMPLFAVATIQNSPAAAVGMKAHGIVTES